MGCVESKRKSYTKWRIDLAIHDALSLARKQGSLRAFQRLLDVAISRSTMLRVDAVGGNVGWHHPERTLRGLLAMAAHRRGWLRDVADWQGTICIPPRSHYEHSSAGQQFSSLARHLFANVEIPEFMVRVWFETCAGSAIQYQRLFKHLGRGNSIRGANLPVALTKPMAKHFMNAPDHLTVEQALRWSQARGWGSDVKFAAELCKSRLANDFRNETTWCEVVQNLIGRKQLDLGLIRPLIDYLYFHRRARPMRGMQSLGRREFNQLLERVREWIEGDYGYSSACVVRWTRSPISGFRLVEQHPEAWSLRSWTIRELTSSQELVEEGEALRHCVASYVKQCSAGDSSIWSLQCEGSLERARLLTIQVLPRDRRIVTALGRCNTRPKPESRHIMERWAASENLEIASWV